MPSPVTSTAAPPPSSSILWFWLGFSAGAIPRASLLWQGAGNCRNARVGQQTGAEGFDEVTFVEGLGLVSLTIPPTTTLLSGDGLIISNVESASCCCRSTSATLLAHDASTGRHRGDGRGLAPLVHREVNGVLVRSQRSVT